MFPVQSVSRVSTHSEAFVFQRNSLLRELFRLNASAAASLDEGLDETLTLHRLGVFAELGTSLKTTNALESIHARVESRTAKVDHWKNSEQKQRWLATALLDLEPRLRRIRNYRALPLLREAIKAADSRCEEVGGVNSGSLTEFQLRMALTPSLPKLRRSR